MPRKTDPSAPDKPRGRPKGSKNKLHPVDYRRALLEHVLHPTAIAAPPVRLDPADAHATEVKPGHPCLRFLRKDERLAWWCLQAYSKHTEEKVVPLGNGAYEIVEVRTQAPNFAAMREIGKILGDYAPMTEVHTGDRVQVLVMAPDNGRGPALPE